MTIGRETHKVPDPFLVLATQNPIETEGTYALPEAQVDRFMLKVLVDYPTDREELVIVDRMARGLDEVRQIISVSDLMAMQKQTDDVYVDPQLMQYAVALVAATRRPEEFGAAGHQALTSPSAPALAPQSILCWAHAPLLSCAAAITWSRTISPILRLDVMRHRVVLSYEALADNVTPDAVIKRVMEVVARPARPLTDDKRPPAESTPPPADTPGMAWQTA